MLKRHDNLRHGFGRGQSEGTLLLHELGHAVGLQHVYDSSQVMNPTITTASPPDYAAGDRTGLRLVGANAGCMRGPWIPAS